MVATAQAQVQPRGGLRIQAKCDARSVAIGNVVLAQLGMILEVFRLDRARQASGAKRCPTDVLVESATRSFGVQAKAHLRADAATPADLTAPLVQLRHFREIVPILSLEGQTAHEPLVPVQAPATVDRQLVTAQAVRQVDPGLVDRTLILGIGADDPPG